MGDIFNAMKIEDKKHREQRLVKAENFDFTDFVKHTDWHWARPLGEGKLDYWPSKAKWRYANKNYHGTEQDLRNFINKRVAK